VLSAACRRRTESIEILHAHAREEIEIGGEGEVKARSGKNSVKVTLCGALCKQHSSPYSHAGPSEAQKAASLPALSARQRSVLPPPHPHLLTLRSLPARKLKKEWVERAKIRSRWKAQKRREGIVSLRSGKFPQEGEDQRQERDGHDTGSEGSVHSDSDSASAEQPGTAFGGPPDSDSNKLSPQSPPPRSPGTRQKKLGKQRQRPRRDNAPIRDATTGSNDEKKSSVRDLFQKAYSKSSLHTYKSDPFKRGQNSHHNRGRGSSNKTRGGAPSRGRGQPNMKLRMNAMLAKITEQTRTQ
jgi:hypothetical protein